MVALRADVSYNARALESLCDGSMVSVEAAGALPSVEKAADALEAALGEPAVVCEELCGDGLAVRTLGFYTGA